ncbi:MAG: adenine phosphoribosyltransferase [bacterium]|nr:adenine phosphoribosyltransferase [bacterium]
MSKRVENAIRKIPDFPKKGIIFRDVTTAIKDADVFKEIIDYFIDKFKDIDFDYIVAMESRGFFLGAPVAYAMGKGLIIVRKPGKLPAETISAEYELEYGTDKLEIHKDAIEPGKKVIIMDDLIATGGTLNASIELVEKLGGKVQLAAFLIELPALKAREIVRSNVPILSMLEF